MIRITTVCLAAFLATASPNAARQGQRGLTAAPELGRAYDAILDGRFDEVPHLLNQACGPAPTEACQLLEAVSLWWQIQLDPFSRARDTAFETQVDAAIAADRGMDTTRAPACGGMVLPWRRVRGAIAVESAAGREAGCRAGRQTNQGLSRARPVAGPGNG